MCAHVFVWHSHLCFSQFYASAARPQNEAQPQAPALQNRALAALAARHWGGRNGREKWYFFNPYRDQKYLGLARVKETRVSKHLQTPIPRDPAIPSKRKCLGYNLL